MNFYYLIIIKKFPMHISTGSKSIRYTPEEAKIVQFMNQRRCNYYLNFSDRRISIDMWKNIEKLFLTNKVYPTILVIDIQNTGLSLNDVNPDLRHMIVI